MISELRPWSDLRNSGLLWLINTTVFHPRGYAMGIVEDGLGWKLIGDGSGPWTFPDKYGVQFAAANRTLALQHRDPETEASEERERELAARDAAVRTQAMNEVADLLMREAGKFLLSSTTHAWLMEASKMVRALGRTGEEKP